MSVNILTLVSFEIKSIPSEIKDIDSGSRRVQKYVSAFGNVDSHGDIMQKGAYAKTIQENKARVKYLWNHNASEMPVGVVEELVEDEHGLLVTSKLLTTTKGNDLLICYQEGAVNEHSVGFYTKQKKSNQAGNRIITEAHLLEYSAVLWGSNENTPVVGMKSTAPLDQLQELHKRSQNLYKLLTKGSLTDETCERLALEHVLITKSMDTILEALQGEKQPENSEENSTAKKQEPQADTELLDLLEAFTKAYKN